MKLTKSYKTMSFNFVNDDCLNAFKDLKDKSIDLIVCDPPYNIELKSEKQNTDWDCKTDEDFMRFSEQWMAEAYRVLKDDGTMWMFAAPTKIPEVFKSVEHAGFHNNLENWLCYVRAKGRGTKHHLMSVREECLHLTKSGKHTWNAVEVLRKVVVPYTTKGKNGERVPRGWALDYSTGDRVRFTGVGNAQFWTSPSYLNATEKQIHLCQKPIMMLCELILLSSQKGETVLDPFAGSGSCGIAAMMCERNWIGFEKDLEMYNKAKGWIAEYEDPESKLRRGLDEYLSKHISSSSPGKYNFADREILPKSR